MGLSSTRAQLGALLRAAREHVRPEDVGLPPRERKRTPGLRREDVARLAEISETYYTWLEQGRVERPTGRVLRQIARALRMSEAQERQLLAVAHGFDPGPESYGVVATERLAAFLEEFSARCLHVGGFEELRHLLLKGLHHPGQLTFFRTLDERVATFQECRGIEAASFGGRSYPLAGPEQHVSTLLAGHVLAVSDLSACDPSLLAREFVEADLHSVIEVAVTLQGAPVAVFGYAEPHHREYSSIERHLMKTIGSMMSCILERRITTHGELLSSSR